MKKLDLRQEYPQLYRSRVGQVQEVMAPKLQFIMVDGQGSPESPAGAAAFEQAIQALYGLSFALKFACKQAGGPDYVVGPLEACWRMADDADFDSARPADWRWTAMIMQPDFITSQEYALALQKLQRTRPSAILNEVRLAVLEEGRSIQTMHQGPYDAEAPTLQRLADYAEAHGYAWNGDHHEIYLSDPRRTAPERLRTILRRPVRAADTACG
ncbi:MAG TPA: GyrI-like domain-containing protein [Candidatus Saccharimonadia bacterium]|nr:GyrI-like domain-containing protein [Candidatus Saccharimonadia bacterium]